MKAAEESEANGDEEKRRGRFVASAFSYAAAGAMFEASATGAFNPSAMLLSADRCYREAAAVLERAADAALQAADPIQRRTQ